MTRNYIEKYKAFLEQRKMQAKSRDNYLRVARRYTAYLEDRGLDVLSAQMTDMLLYLSSRSANKTSTYNIELRQLKYYLHFVAENGGLMLVDTDQFRKKTEPRQLPKNIPVKDLHLLCTPTQAERERSDRVAFVREQAIIEFLASTGVRQIELRQAKIGQLSKDLRSCLIPGYKGSRDRMVYLGVPAREALIAWLLKRGLPLDPQASAGQYLFVTNRGKPLHASVMIDLVRRVALRRLGYAITPHILRHTFATEMLRATGSLRSVQEMMGHVTIKTTGVYCGLDLSDHRRAINVFHPHGSGIDDGGASEYPPVLPEDGD